MNSCAGLFNPNAILTSISSGGGSSGSSSSSSLPTATSFPSSTTTSACSAVETEFREKAYIEIKKELERNLQDSILQLEDLKTMLLGTFPPIILDMKVKDALNGAIQEQLRPAKRLKTGGAEEAQQDGPGALQRKPLNTPGPDVVVAARTGFSAGHTRDQYGTGRANPEPGIKNGLASSPPLAGQTPLLAASVASSSAAAEVKQVNAANFPSRPGGFGPAPMRRVAGSPGPALAPAAAASAVSTTTTNPISRPMAGLASLFKPPAHDTDVLVGRKRDSAASETSRPSRLRTESG
ncbi:unnamed protein product [Amoebophrya sp. A120]|nr:unnamed protein product [Amoebophrya sp. A120]|eukprot:GSA120T00001692001.1